MKPLSTTLKIDCINPISFFKQENSGNGYATDDENNESNKDTSTDKRKTEKH